MYLNGRGVTQDDTEAFKWFRKPAEQGLPGPQYTVGLMYQNGQGVSRDDAEAARWYRKAAEQGDAMALNNLGFMYLKGQGVPKDYVQAHMWSNLAVARGYEKAAINRNLAERRMTSDQIFEAERLAREWTEKHQK